MEVPELPVLRAEDTARIAGDLVARQPAGAADAQGTGRLRFFVLAARARPLPRQHVSPARHLRHRHAGHRVADSDARGAQPSAVLADAASLKNGIVLVTGPTGSGKSSTLAAIIDLINETRADHILTIEDPIEFLHQHKKATVHQRELHSDTPTSRGAPGGAAAGAEGDPGRRDARPRDDRDRADGGRDGPPGLLDAPYDRRRPRPSSASSARSNPPISRRSARAWPRRSATSSRSG